MTAVTGIEQVIVVFGFAVKVLNSSYVLRTNTTGVLAELAQDEKHCIFTLPSLQMRMANGNS